jgi:cold shock CspA family protein
MSTALQILEKYWGHNQFRPLQEGIIDAVLAKKDVLALLPTGGGKSICFQVPALLKDGMCLVISPLIALMQDQVSNLQEKGIDVWLALEAMEQTYLKKFNVIVLITSDGDYVPLIRKLNTMGSRVMVISWDFEYTTDDGSKMVTKTSQDLIEEVTYPIAMHEIIENRIRKNDPLVANLFVQPNPAAKMATRQLLEMEGERHVSTVHSLKTGYGFINYPPNNLFFHFSSLVDTDFAELREGDEVEFIMDINEKGEPIAKAVRLLYDEQPPA